MTPTVVAAVIGAAALPLIGYARSVRGDVRIGLATTCLLAVVLGLVSEPGAVGATVFALVFASGLVISFWRTEATVDSNRRAAAGLEPLMKGDPAIRGLYDIVWLLRYRRKMREDPILE